MPEKTRESKGPFSRIRKEHEEKQRLAAAFSEERGQEVERICDSAEPGAVIYATDEAERRGWWPIVEHAVENGAARVARHAVDAEARGRRWRALLDIDKRQNMKDLGTSPYIVKQFARVRIDEVEEAIKAQDWDLLKAFSEYAKGAPAKLAKEAYERNRSGRIVHLEERARAGMRQQLKENAPETGKRFRSLRQP
ncbi:MAG: hypothetical protein PHF51_04910 [Candidatus ainarchaeum sp.]|nr:hypothetical protein [Candidatus ainarchaeum sp.]